MTVTAVTATPADAWHWEVREPDGQWRRVTPTHAEALLPDRTTPFTLAARTVTSAIRLCADAEVTIRQLELFKKRTEVANNDKLKDADKQAQLKELDAELAKLEQRMAEREKQGGASAG